MKISFGTIEQGTEYTERRAAYGVVLGARETVAVVKGPTSRFWLPGGGAYDAESAEETLEREFREELARGVRVLRKVGEATQFFYAADDNRNYRMQAVFFLAEFAEELDAKAADELCWIPWQQKGAFFHECHAWAVDQALVSRDEF